ncbi:MAG: hypothetical protein EOO24_01905 [Comamonadaceae bacterium]|nr:MAG: hypothetical protein EOO24_01905 [Comamonadaceae bacterium]
MAGPLEGLRVVEMAGLGPGPLCGRVMTDLGADVACIERPGAPHAIGRPGETPPPLDDACD